jgi:hypothetical protein
MSTALLRRAFWGGLQDHEQPCDECVGSGHYDDGDECDVCSGEGSVFWGSFYGGREGGCDFCTHGGDGDVLIASMYENGHGQEWVCLRCYLKHHRDACGCARWAAVEAAVHWPTEPTKPEPTTAHQQGAPK